MVLKRLLIFQQKYRFEMTGPEACTIGKYTPNVVAVAEYRFQNQTKISNLIASAK